MKLEVGKLYRIKFYDHGRNITEAIECETVGWLLDQCKVRAAFSWWKTLNLSDLDNEYNTEKFVIVKACIISITPLK